VTITLESTGDVVLVIADGVKIARRIRGKWVVLVPGWKVTGNIEIQPPLFHLPSRS
jgi:hypothetical protein